MDLHHVVQWLASFEHIHSGGGEMYRILSCLIVLFLTSAASAQLGIKPGTPAPRPFIREAFMPKDDILLSYPMEKFELGKTRWLWKYHKRKPEDMVVTNALGEELTEKQIAEALKKPTMVLLSADGKPVHPYYLTVFKPDTLVIVDTMPHEESVKFRQR